MLRKFYNGLFILAILPAVSSTISGNFMIQLLLITIIIGIYYYYSNHHHNYIYDKYEDIIGPKPVRRERRLDDSNLSLIKDALPRDPEVLRFIQEKSRLKTWTIVVILSFLFVLYFRK